MKRFICLYSLILSFVCTGSAQITFSAKIHIKADTLSVKKYKPETCGKHEESLTLRMHYNEIELEQMKSLLALPKSCLNILAIDYVYTHNNDGEVQEAINRQRLVNLWAVAPFLFDQSTTRWRFIEQQPQAIGAAKETMFHGFVVRYTLTPTYTFSSDKSIKEKLLELAAHPADTTVASIMKRMPPLEKPMVVCDLTGSMGPYYLEIMAWFVLKNFKKTNPFVFFNDGNARRDEEKQPGRTEGIYAFCSNSVDTIARYMMKTIKGGNGGDTPENNIEAIIAGQKQFSESKSIIMLADNCADMRDYHLRGAVTKPVHILLCNYHDRVNPQYLNLAYATKGSVYSMAGDLDHLSSMGEGTEFSFGTQRFKIRAGAIVEIRPEKLLSDSRK